MPEVPTSTGAPAQLTKLVADNVLALDQKWWLRVATRNDAAASREERDRLGALANSVMRIVDVRRSPAARECCNIVPR